jgi:hypothetical protein
MKKFFESLSKSMFSPDFYKNPERFTFSDGLRHLTKLSLVFAGVAILFVSISLSVFFFSGRFQEFVSAGIDLYPQDLMITIEDGELSLNQPEPYVVAVPQGWEVNGGEGNNGIEDVQYFAVIDTKDDPSLRLAQEYATVMLIGKDSFGVLSENGKFEVYSIPREINVVIDQAWLSEKAMWFSKKFMQIGIPLILILTPLFVFSGSLVSLLLYLLFGALIIWFVAFIKKIPFGYGRAYLVGMYLVTAPQILSVLAMSLPGVWIPFFRTFLLTVMATLYLKKEENQPSDKGEVSSQETVREDGISKEKTDSDTTPSAKKNT